DKFCEILKSEFNREYQPKEERTESAWLKEGGSGTEFVFGKVPMQDKSNSDVVVENNVLKSVRIKQENKEFVLHDGSIVIAAITSCTNTSNPAVMVGAGLLARNAVNKGLRTKSWVKT